MVPPERTGYDVSEPSFGGEPMLIVAAIGLTLLVLGLGLFAYIFYLTEGGSGTTTRVR